jgi:SHS2 domain-containing protein
MKEFELLEHPADLKIKAFGKRKEELFINMMRGMFESIKFKRKKEKQKMKREIKIGSIDLRSLLVDFLSEVLYLSDVHNEAYLGGEITITDDTRVAGRILGQAVDGFEEEIKAVTHHGLGIEKVNDHWEAVVLFDI